jgi:drug/metabolite transporter (DMT)-like permease
MKNNQTLTGHIAAGITIMIWGTTFISTKILLNDLAPIEILFIRFVIGYIALWFAAPHRLKITVKRREIYFALAGLCGITLYYLLENIALSYTLASIVGVIISAAPFFTAISDSIFLKGKRPDLQFFIGFIIAMTGICLISFHSVNALSFSPMGIVLALAAAMIWAIYSTLVKKISTFGYSTIQVTRHTFFYGLLFMLPTLFIFDFRAAIIQYMNFTILANLLFLGLGASALCFVTWNYAVKLIGSVKTSVYIYMVPVITTIISAMMLHEQISFITICGILLTLLGLFLSENKKRKKTEPLTVNPAEEIS